MHDVAIGGAQRPGINRVADGLFRASSEAAQD